MTKVYITQAFIKDYQGGNGAGVVFDTILTNKQKKQISKEVGLSETAFVYKGIETDYIIEYFTPVEEVDLCGHATIAAFSTMYQLHMIDPDIYTISTKAGQLQVLVYDDGTIMMQQNQPTYLDILDQELFKDVFDLTLLNQNYPIQIVSTGLKDIIVPIKSKEALNNLIINHDALSQCSKQLEVIGIHAFAFDDQNDCLVRNFAPLYGINEESATGTANCALACYLWKYGLQKENYLFEQGHQLNSISHIHVHLEYDEHIQMVYVGGKGKLMNDC